MKNRLGDLSAIAHAEFVVLTEEARHQRIGRSVKTQNRRQRFGDAIDHHGHDTRPRNCLGLARAD